MAGLDEALERLVTDTAFRQRLAADPAGALAGYELSDADRALLASQVSEASGASGAVDRRASKASLAGMMGAVGDMAEALAGSGGEAPVQAPDDQSFDDKHIDLVSFGPGIPPAATGSFPTETVRMAYGQIEWTASDADIITEKVTLAHEHVEPAADETGPIADVLYSAAGDSGPDSQPLPDDPSPGGWMTSTDQGQTWDGASGASTDPASLIASDPAYELYDYPGDYPGRFDGVSPGEAPSATPTAGGLPPRMPIVGDWDGDSDGHEDRAGRWLNWQQQETIITSYSGASAGEDAGDVGGGDAVASPGSGSEPAADVGGGVLNVSGPDVTLTSPTIPSSSVPPTGGMPIAGDWDGDDPDTAVGGHVEIGAPIDVLITKVQDSDSIHSGMDSVAPDADDAGVPYMEYRLSDAMVSSWQVGTSATDPVETIATSTAEATTPVEPEPAPAAAAEGPVPEAAEAPTPAPAEAPALEVAKADEPAEDRPAEPLSYDNTFTAVPAAMPAPEEADLDTEAAPRG